MGSGVDVSVAGNQMMVAVGAVVAVAVTEAGVGGGWIGAQDARAMAMMMSKMMMGAR